METFLSIASLSQLETYTLPEIRQLAIYMETYQNCAFIEPENKLKKKSWLASVNQMIIAKGCPNPREYIVRLRSIIRWFLDHRFRFVRNSTSVFDRMVREFAYIITDANIRLEDTEGRVFNIGREDMDLSKHLSYISRKPVNRLAQAAQQSTTEEGRVNNEDKPKRDKDPRVDEPANTTTSTLECKVCLIHKICVVLSSCGHAFCYSCTKQLEHKCAICRKAFSDRSIIRMYI